LFFFKVPSNSVFQVGDVGQPFTIYCNNSASSANQAITWVQTKNKTGFFPTTNSSRITFSNNGQQLNFASLFLSDEEYYACGYLNGSSYKIYNSYYLFIRGLTYIFPNQTDIKK
jgi:hypothetical protein